MNLQHLKNITEVERAGSVTKAAANLFMGQPNLSKSIKEVENEIGITVFRRSAKGVYPTPEGARFLSRARAVLEEMDKLEALYKQENTVRSITVCVPEVRFVTEAAAEFVRSLSGEDRINFECIPAPLSRAAANVCEGICSIAAVRCSETDEEYFRKLLSEMNLRSEPLITGEYKLVISEKSPLSGDNDIRAEELSELTRLSAGDSSHSGMISENRINICGGDILELLARIPEGYMISPAICPETLENFGLVQKNLCAAEKYTEYLIFPAGYKPDEYTGAFISCLKKEINLRKGLI